MSREDFDRLPETLTVREVHFQIYQKGFRPIVVTTLLDPKQFPRRQLAQLYPLRASCYRGQSQTY